MVALRMDRIVASLGLVLFPGLTATSLAGGEYEIDSVHSSALFRVKHMDITPFYGRFNDLSGTFGFDKDDPAKSSIQVVIKADSIDTKDGKRDTHLKSPDFFNAREFPELKFTSQSCKAAGENKYEVSGDLTIHGVTKPITVTVECTGEGQGPHGVQLCGLETNFSIKRTDFGMDYGVGPLGENVKIIVALEGTRE